MSSTATKTKSIYFFGGTQTEGAKDMRNTIGGKGANLAEMSNLGIPVPPGFTIATSECDVFYDNNESLSDELKSEIREYVGKVESLLGKTLGDNSNPLLFSVRSGARVSMPGMMDTILNLGLNDESVVGLATQSGSERFAWDSYRRFIQMFCSVVLGIDHHGFEKILAAKKQKNNYNLDTELSSDDWKEIVAEYKSFVQSKGLSFPQDAYEQLYLSVGSVFKSWRADRAYKYRDINSIPHTWGTAVNVQAMVFGNLGDTSGTGVAFTRNPSTGENVFYGEYLVNAQGEDVVAGIRTPEPIATLEQAMPEVYAELVQIYQKLELHFQDMQDIEFTIENGTLYILQTRVGKRTAAAAVKIAVDHVNEGLIDHKEAVKRVAPEQVDQLLHPTIDPSATVDVLTKGLPASPGAAVGRLVFTAEDAEAAAANNESVILIREETSPEDIGGMHAAVGILTARGGMTSHAAVVARGMGKCCVAGCESLDIDEANKTVTVNGATFTESDSITLNGSTGDVISGDVPLVEAQITPEFKQILEWADTFRTLNIRTNAETPHDVQVARDFGAEGIGLCRTEHMFFEGDRIRSMRKMILSNTLEARCSALNELFPLQKNDFKAIFKTMNGFPVTIRLLDPPLHEFLPHDDAAVNELAKEMNLSAEEVHKKVHSLKEMNPMLGHRGCRLGISFPEIYEMQAKAIIEAAVEAQSEGSIVIPEIMVPLVGHKSELAVLRELIEKTAESILSEKSETLAYSVGTMIEVPRAALMADEVVQEADFFSFGTNDLTQLTLGISRDDAGRFLGEYVENGVLADDPFQTIDQDGVGRLIEFCIDKARAVKPDLKVGICGEHGGEGRSIQFCHKQNFNYVSCSPFRVPVARVAAAHAAIG